MVYFDTSFLAPLFRREETSGRVEQFIKEHSPGELAISQWTRVEFSSLLARDVRMGLMSAQLATNLNLEFEETIVETFAVVLPDANDFNLCKLYLQRFETGLRAGDALHLAIGHNRRMRAIYSLDRKLLRAGRLLGLPIESGIRGRS